MQSIRSKQSGATRAILSLALLGFLLAGCGGGNDSADASVAQTANALGTSDSHNAGDIGDPLVTTEAPVERLRAFSPVAATALVADEYITIENGSLPVVISAPHGGEMAVPGVAIRTTGTTVMDWNTYPIAIAIQNKLLARTGRKAYVVAAKVRRKYVDFNRSDSLAYESLVVKPIYDRYYGALRDAVNLVRQQSPAAAILIDVHGQSSNARVTYRGTRDGATANNMLFYAAPAGLITTMNSGGLNVNPSRAGSLDNVNFNGGNIVWSFGKNTSQGINSVQFEFGYNYRNTTSDVEFTATKMTDAIIAHLRSNGAL